MKVTCHSSLHRRPVDCKRPRVSRQKKKKMKTLYDDDIHPPDKRFVFNTTVSLFFVLFHLLYTKNEEVLCVNKCLTNYSEYSFRMGLDKWCFMFQIRFVWFG